MRTLATALLALTLAGAPLVGTAGTADATTKAGSANATCTDTSGGHTTLTPLRRVSQIAVETGAQPLGTHTRPIAPVKVWAMLVTVTLPEGQCAKIVIDKATFDPDTYTYTSGLWTRYSDTVATRVSHQRVNGWVWVPTSADGACVHFGAAVKVQMTGTTMKPTRYAAHQASNCS